MRTTSGRVWLVGLLLLATSAVQAAGKVDFGLGLSFVDDLRSEALAGAWDLQVGYEVENISGWNIGWQLQATQESSSRSEFYDETDMAYSSTGLYLTASPYRGWFHLKGGVMDVRYQTLTRDIHSTGIGIGAGLVVDYPGLRIHLLDFQRVMVGAESFNMYTLSITVLTSGYYR